MMVSICFAQVLQKRLKTQAIHARQVKAQALAAGGIERCIEIGPLVGASDDVGRAKALRTISPSVPVDQSKACFVEGQDLQRFVGTLALAALFNFLGELFLKASCFSLSAFSWRGPPVFSFTLRRL